MNGHFLEVALLFLVCDTHSLTTLLGHQPYLGLLPEADILKLLKNRTLPTSIFAVANESNTLLTAIHA